MYIAYKYVNYIPGHGYYSYNIGGGDVAQIYTFGDSKKLSVIKYKLHDWTKPKIQNSKLFVFDTLENAKVLNPVEIGGKNCGSLHVMNLKCHIMRFRVLMNMK